MYRFAIFAALTAGLCFSAEPQSLKGKAGAVQAAPAKPAAPTSVTPASITPRGAGGLPKDAVANPDGTWTYTDKQNKKWLYSKTAFGIARAPLGDGAPATGPTGIPKGAVSNPDGTYSWTDAQGKPWVLTMTPFGISRRQGTSEATAPIQPVALEPEIKATANGEFVRFERRGLVGASVWQKKRSELNEEESRIFNSQNPATTEAGK